MSKLLGLEDPCKVLYNGEIHYVLSLTDELGACINGHCIIPSTNTSTNMSCTSSHVNKGLKLAYVDIDLLLQVLINSGLNSSTGEPYTYDTQLIRDELDALFAISGRIPVADRSVLIGSLTPYISILSKYDTNLEQTSDPISWQKMLVKVRAVLPTIPKVYTQYTHPLGIAVPCKASFKGKTYYVLSSQNNDELGFCSNSDCLYTNATKANVRCSPYPQPTIINTIPQGIHLASIDIDTLKNVFQVISQPAIDYRVYTTNDDIMKDIDVIFAVTQYVSADESIKILSTLAPFITIISSTQQVPDVTGISPPFSWDLIKSYQNKYTPYPAPSPSSLAPRLLVNTSPAPAPRTFVNTSPSPAPPTFVNTSPSPAPHTFVNTSLSPAQNSITLQNTLSPYSTAPVEKGAPSSTSAIKTLVANTFPNMAPSPSQFVDTGLGLLNQTTPSPAQNLLNQTTPSPAQNLLNQTTPSPAQQNLLNQTTPSPAPGGAQAKKTDSLLVSILIGIALLLVITGITYLILR